MGSIPDINGTIGAALILEDQRESSRLIEEQAGLAFDMIQGEKVTRLNADIEDMQSTVQRSKQTINIPDFGVQVSTDISMKNHTPV